MNSDNIPVQTKRCYECKTSKPLADFNNNRAKHDGLSSECRACNKMRLARYAAENPGAVKKQRAARRARPGVRENDNKKTYALRGEKPDHYREIGRKCYANTPAARKRQRLKLFGLTPEVFAEMTVAQNGCCAICRQPETRKVKGKVVDLSIDHCHRTTHVRALLCNNCNVALGLLKDDPKRMIEAANYVIFFAQAHNKLSNIIPFSKAA